MKTGVRGRRVDVARRDDTEATVPALVVDRSREAGASALRWFEEELLKITDPSGRWLAAGRALDGVLRTGAVLLAFGLVLNNSVGWALLILAAGGVSLVRSSFTRVSAAAATVMLSAALLASTHEPGLVGLLLFAVPVALLLRLSLSSAVEMNALLAVVTVAWLGGVGGDVSRLWVLFVVVVCVIVAGEYLQTRSFLLSRPLFVSEKITLGRMPAVRVEAPWLTRVMCLSKAKQDTAPPELTRKRAGVWGERRTGVMLMALRSGRGTRIVHDVVVPGAKNANADTIVVAPSGWYVCDSKQYGTTRDPGRVVHDESRGVVEHVSNRGVRDVTGSIRTLAWSVRAVAEFKGRETGPSPRGVLVVHNAAVDPGIVVHEGGMFIDVISADRLLSRIDGSSQLLSRKEMAASKGVLGMFTAAAYGGDPDVVAPMGWPWARVKTWHGSQVVTGRSEPTQIDVWETPTPNSDTEPIPVRRKSWSDPNGDVRAPQVDDRVDVEGDGWQDVQASESTVVLPKPTTAQHLLEEGWRRMDESPLAAPDDVPPEWRGVEAGTPVVHLSFDEVSNDPRGQDLIFVKGPCAVAAPDGDPFVWVCEPQDWAWHKENGAKMRVATVSLSKLMRRTW